MGVDVLSENQGGVERDYVPDPRGSTVARYNNTLARTDSFVDWPYG